MIVKNESHIIEKTLENIVKNFNIDYWVISDTGSSDNTIQLIEEFFKKKNIKGEILEADWVDFAYNRNLALDACKGKADYILIFDADDLVEGNLKLPELIKDGYYFNIREDEAQVTYSRRLIIKNETYKWVGVVHELLEPIGVVEDEYIEGNYYIVSRRLGARNQDNNKALNDALVLEKEYIRDGISQNLKARYAFYCARSYFAYAISSNLDEYYNKAIYWFEERLKFDLEISVQDTYIACENLGLLYEKTERFDKAVEVWELGTRIDPDRAECWYDLTRYYNNNQELNEAYRCGMQGVYLPVPEHTKHMINLSVYTYGMLYEMCIICWKLRELEKSYLYFKKALSSLPKIFVENIDYIFKSFRFYFKNDSEENKENLILSLDKLDCKEYFNFDKYPKLCLNMIVKNESNVILETLNCLVKHFDLDYWVISDTGSTDNTIEIIKNFFNEKKIQGEIHENKWVNFEVNRNKALDLCVGKSDYVLFFDADDLIQGNFILPKLDSDSYVFKFKEENEDLLYSRRLIVKNNKKFKWKGVLHEVLIENENYQGKNLGNFFIEGDYSIISRHIGSRNLNKNKTYDDISILESAFKDERDYIFQSRYAFYLGKYYFGLSLKQKKYIDKAIEWFKLRVSYHLDLDGIDDEIYCSLLSLGVLYNLKNCKKEAIDFWKKGVELDCNRAECLYSLINIYYLNREYRIAYEYGVKCVDLPLPSSDRLLVNKAIYDYHCLLIMCLITSKLKKYNESYSYFKRLLPELPPQLFKNLRTIMNNYTIFFRNEDIKTLSEMKLHFKRIGRENYLDGVLR